MNAKNLLNLGRTRLCLIFLLIATATHTLLAQGYNETMNATIMRMYKTHNTDSLVEMSKVFVELSKVAEDKWYPYYYASYSLVRIAFIERNSKHIDKYLDNAQIYLDSMQYYAGDKSEMLVLQALLYSMRITNPARGMKYSVLSNLKLDEAQEVNASNPRIYYCRGNNLYFTPSFFGGGKDKALVQFRIAEKLYLKHISISDLTPSWDFKHNQEMIKKCLKN